ncbi:TPA: formate dehydrogenase accessory sulfurtransferase FdhD, partial [Burkholderia cenocepacia]
MESCTRRDDPTGSTACQVTRHRAGAACDTVDRVVDETPVALVFNGIAHTVMMATPIDLDAFGLGFALSEGIVERASDVFDIESECRPGSAEVRLTVSQQAFMALKAHRRALAGRTGCGVCGIESIAQLDLHPPRIAAAGTAAGIGADAIARAARALPARQTLMRETGGIHAAAWCDR